MYVCLCRAITDKEIKEKSKIYSCPTPELLKKLGVGTDCGACVQQACSLLSSSNANSSHHEVLFNPIKKNF
jgi:bacterioferritin-associated ferredoxin